jgi:hypothetical protein
LNTFAPATKKPNNMFQHIEIKILTFGLIALFLLGCKPEKPVSIPKVTTPKKVEWQKSTTYSYRLPVDSAHIQGVIIVLDPQGNPKPILGKIEETASANQLAIIGLNDIKNGVQDFENIIQRDYNHFINYKKISNAKLYLVGFSGGARMAAIYAANNRIDGLIVCGAGLGRVNQFPFPTAMISGTQDFNFVEQFYGPNDQRTYQKGIIALHFRGKHQWPPDSLLSQAQSFIINSGTNTDDSQAKEYEQQSKSELAQKNYFLAFKAMETAYKLSDKSHESERLEQLKTLSKNSRLAYQFTRMEKYLEEEQTRNQTLNDYVEKQDLSWWTKQIHYIENKAAGKRDEIAADSYARTLAFMGIVMYSKTLSAISGRTDFAQTPKFLEIYAMVDPQNPDLHFFKAVTAYAQNKEEQAISLMQQAKELGFDNPAMMSNFFSQEFINRVNNAPKD